MASGRDCKIPIKMNDFALIDKEFGSIREKFEAEMRNMEEAMSKFRSDLMSRESNNFFKSTSSTTTTQSSHNTGSDVTSRPSGDVRTWLDDLNSPLIQGDGDSKCLKLRFDVSQYSPEEIVVKTVDNKLMVHAKHEEKTDTKSVYREYNREFLLPKGTNPKVFKSVKQRWNTYC